MIFSATTGGGGAVTIDTNLEDFGATAADIQVFIDCEAREFAYEPEGTEPGTIVLDSSLGIVASIFAFGQCANEPITI